MLHLVAVAIGAGAIYVGNSIYNKIKDKDDKVQENEPKNTILSEKENSFYLKTSLIGVGTTILGTLLYKPIALTAIPINLYVGFPIFKKAFINLKNRKIKVEILDSVAIIAGLSYGYYFFTSVLNLVYFSSIELLERTRDKNRKNIIKVFTERPSFVWLVTHNIETKIEISKLSIGDIIVVNAGEVIPIDGVVEAGIATINQQALTGEAQPSEKEKGDSVFAFTIVIAGKIYIKVQTTGEQSIATQIEQVLNSTDDFELSLNTKAEKISDNTVLPTVGLATLGLFSLGAYSSITILSSNFTEAIRVSTPISMINFLTLANENSIFIKDGRSLEVLNDIDTIVFDKTGTLTEEEPYVGDIYTCNNLTKSEILLFAATAEYKQTHPIAKAIIKKANERNLKLLTIDENYYEIGYGIKVKIDDKFILVGSKKFMEIEKINIPQNIHNLSDKANKLGYSTIYIAIDSILEGVLELRPTIRKEAKEIIEKLKNRNLSIYIISGDHEIPTKHLAKELRIDKYFAQSLPEDKSMLIEKLQKDGKKVCFIGDGINDSIALKKANVSISMRGASSIATDTAQIILLDKSLRELDNLFEISQEFNSNIKRGFNLVLIPSTFFVGGVFLFHLGIFSSILFYEGTFIASLANSILTNRKKLKLKKPKGKE